MAAPRLSHEEQADRYTHSHRFCSCMYTLVFMLPGKLHITMFTFIGADFPTCRHTAVALCSH